MTKTQLSQLQKIYDLNHGHTPAHDSGDFDDHFTAEDYERREYDRSGWTGSGGVWDGR